MAAAALRWSFCFVFSTNFCFRSNASFSISLFYRISTSPLSTLSDLGKKYSLSSVYLYLSTPVKVHVDLHIYSRSTFKEETPINQTESFSPIISRPSTVYLLRFKISRVNLYHNLLPSYTIFSYFDTLHTSTFNIQYNHGQLSY